MDEIHKAAERSGRPIKWTQASGWELLPDAEILRLVRGSDIIGGLGDAILLPALCFYGRHLPFEVPCRDLEDFVKGFEENYGEAFFNGDTYILTPTMGTLYLFQHDGFYGKLTS
jgi:hypothetical protein